MCSGENNTPTLTKKGNTTMPDINILRQSLVNYSTPGYAKPVITKRALPPKRRQEAATAMSPYEKAFAELGEALDPELCVEVMSEGKSMKPVQAAYNAQNAFNAKHKATTGLRIVSRSLGLSEQVGKDGSANVVVGFWLDTSSLAEAPAE